MPETEAATQPQSRNLPRREATAMSRVDHLHVIDAGMHVCITVLGLGVWPPQCHIFLLPPPIKCACYLCLSGVVRGGVVTLSRIRLRCGEV